ncbi:CD-NTase-associated endodeoxyribonuclease Cap4 [Evansella halocellulosilytica]|uniref:CD-NTase-associated endodeoxyribonuclease Cap4 n=1 Tax=Evansella halocellulosilytica TaxID=2011013 RepID=UPI000BB75617|nr:SAVED domain-containing protein [Evansella halocellulosilytica]
MMKNENGKQSPSLLEKESTGGDIASSGFDFQAYLILCKLPHWLSFEGFSSVIWESVGDIEAKFFDPQIGEVIEAIEAKDHRITPTEFWEEINRFKKMDEGSPGTYRWFTLSCTGLSETLHPLKNGLRRLRDPYPFYSHTSGVFENSYEEYKEKVIGLGKSEEMAEFLFHKVSIEDKWGSLSEKAKGMFNNEFNQHLPGYDLRGSEQEKVFDVLHSIVRSQKNKPVFRQQLKQAMHSVIGEDAIPTDQKIYIHTEIYKLPKEPRKINFLWEPFFGEKDRKYPESAVWTEELYNNVVETKKWIEKNRSSKRIHLSGNRRLSSAMAIGSVFSSVSGFSIEAEQREGGIWATDAHPNNQTPECEFVVDFEEGVDNQLIVTIGITRDSIANEVAVYLKGQRHSISSKLHLHTESPIITAEQANLVVKKLKKEIKAAATKVDAEKVHLFYAGPSHLVLFLGHRWNGMPSVQCYEWVNTGQYVPTCTF